MCCIFLLNFPKFPKNRMNHKTKNRKKKNEKKNPVLRFLRKQTRKIKNKSKTLISYFKNVLNFLASKTIQKILFDRNGYNLWNVIDRRRSQRSINEPLPRRWSRRFCLSRFGDGSHGLNHAVWLSKRNYSRRANSFLGSNEVGVIKRLDSAVDELQRRRCCFCIHCRIERPLEGESARL